MKHCCHPKAFKCKFALFLLSQPPHCHHMFYHNQCTLTYKNQKLNSPLKYFEARHRQRQTLHHQPTFIGPKSRGVLGIPKPIHFNFSNLPRLNTEIATYQALSATGIAPQFFGSGIFMHGERPGQSLSCCKYPTALLLNLEWLRNAIFQDLTKLQHSTPHKGHMGVSQLFPIAS